MNMSLEGEDEDIDETADLESEGSDQGTESEPLQPATLVKRSGSNDNIVNK